MKHICFLLTLTIISVALNGQDDLNIFPQIVTPSPNATALGNYGDIPVGYYNGLPDISIPLYTIHSGNITLPITLSYQAKGVKVAQEASWVGLGWSLNAGGVITRKINSLDDFESDGYLSTEEIQGYNPGNFLPDYHMWLGYASAVDLELYEKLEDYYYGIVDGQPDNFYFNFCGYSGELFFQKQSGNVVATIVHQSNLSFSYNKTSKEWVVTDEKGWKYYFGTKEISQNISSGAGTFQESPIGNWSEEMITAWYLDRVLAIDGDEVNFTYSNSGSYIESQPSYDEMSILGPFYTFNVNSEPGLVWSNIHGTRYFASISRINEVYLNRIDFNEGYVEFGLSDRSDMKRSLNASYSQKLEYIEISNLDESLNKYIFFDYSYFRNDMLNNPSKENFLRLKLDKVYEAIPFSGGSLFIDLPPHEFNYNESVLLPAKNSFSIDHWGYYNGADQSNIRNYNFISLNDILGGVTYVNENETSTISSLMPRYMNFDSKKVFFNGANRETNINFIKAASLESIKYPTGGITQFEFEPNDFYKYGLRNDTKFTEIVHSMGTNSMEISVPSPGAIVFLEFNLENNYYPNSGGIDETDMDATMSVKKEDNTWEPFIEFVPSEIHTPIPGMTSNICIALDPGTYQIKADHLDADYLEMELKATFLCQPLCTSKYADGLRIKSIKNYETEGGELFSNTTFDYTQNGHSSGIIMSQLESFYNETNLVGLGETGIGNVPCCFLGSLNLLLGYANYLITYGSSIRPISNSARGHYIGYSTVTVSNHDNDGATSGRSVYYYHNSPDEEYPYFFPGVESKRDFQNGQLMKVEYFNHEDQKVKEITYDYSTDESTKTTIIGVKTMRPTSPYGTLENLGVIARFYQVDSEWWHKISENTTIYATDGSNNFVETHTDYDFENNNHKLLTKETTYPSDGSEIKKIFKYPLDITNPSEIHTTTEILNTLVNNHLYNFNLLSETYINQELIDGQINCPKLNDANNNSPVVGSIWKFETDQYNKKSELDYSTLNRPVQYTPTYNHPVTTLWGYNYTLPIAKIENKTFDIVLEILESPPFNTTYEQLQTKSSEEIKTIFQNLRGHIQMKDAMIFSYTYTPLKGMTSETDPAGKTTDYEYDDFGRLVTIKDQDGKVIKHIDYHYAEEENK